MTNFEHFNGSYFELVQKVKNANKIALIDIFATWCGPCQRLGQILPGIAQKHQSILFLKVDGDKNQEITMRFGVSAYPTIKFVKYENNDLIVMSEVVGLNVPGIQSRCEEYSKITLSKCEEPGPYFNEFEGSFDDLVRKIGTFNVKYAVIEAYRELPEGLDRVLRSISNDFPKLHFLRINLDKNDEIDAILHPKQLPTVLFYHFANESIYRCFEITGMDTVSIREKCAEVMKLSK